MSLFITFEGGDGSGKTTQIRALRDRLEAHGVDVLLTREPGGSTGAEEIRALILTGDFDRWSAMTELLLFNAARRDHIEKVILPALARGTIVLCDRFVDSTRAFQGVAGELSIDIVNQLHDMVIGKDPDFTLVFDMDPAKALARTLARSGDELRMESKGETYQDKLRAAYLVMAQAEPQRFEVIDADGTVDEVAARLDAVLQKRVPQVFRYAEPALSITPA